LVELNPGSQSPPPFEAVLMRPTSVTHHFDAEQRYLDLEVTASVMTPGNPKRWTLTINPPSDPTLMPPGYYMLFIRSGATVSAARTVRLQ